VNLLAPTAKQGHPRSRSRPKFLIYVRTQWHWQKRGTSSNRVYPSAAAWRICRAACLPHVRRRKCVGCLNNHQPGFNRKMIESTSISTASWNNCVSIGHLVVHLNHKLIQPSTRNQPENDWINQCFDWWLNKGVVLDWEIVWEKDGLSIPSVLLSKVSTSSACGFWAL